MQALPHTGHVTPAHIIYKEAGTHFPTQIFTNCVLTQNTKKFNTVQIPCLLSDIPLPTASCKPHTTKHTHTHTHTLHATSRTDRQTDMVCTWRSLLYFTNGAHKPRIWTNLQWHKAQYILTVIKIIQQLWTWHMQDGRTDRHDYPTVFDCCTSCEQHITNCMWFQVSSTVSMRSSLFWMWHSIDWCLVGDVSGQPINSILKGWDQQVVPKRR